VTRSPVDIIAAVLHDLAPVSLHYNAAEHARVILAALREAGWELYRPDEAREIVVGNDRAEEVPWSLNVDWNVGEAWLETDLPDGTYRLVPVEGENP